MKLTEPIVFIRLSFGLPSRKRKVRAGAAKMAEAIGAEQKRLSHTAKLYSGEAFSRITAAQSYAKAGLLRLAIQIPLDIRGAYVLPRALLDRAEKLLTEARDDREKLRDAFIKDEYAAERERSEKELGDEFDPSDYPPVNILRDQFTMSWRYFALDVPEELPKKVRDREMKKLQAEIKQVGDDCRLALRDGLSKFVGHLVERLTPDADGKPKRMESTTVTNLREFLDTVALRDITGDADLQKLATQAKKVLGDADAGRIKDSKSLSAKIRSGLEVVSKQVETLIRVEGGRRFNFDATEDAAA